MCCFLGKNRLLPHPPIRENNPGAGSGRDGKDQDKGRGCENGADHGVAPDVTGKPSAAKGRVEGPGCNKPRQNERRRATGAARA